MEQKPLLEVDVDDNVSYVMLLGFQVPERLLRELLQLDYFKSSMRSFFRDLRMNLLEVQL